MSLDTEKLHRLKSKKFDILYATHEEKWKEMVANATAFAKTFLKDGTFSLRMSYPWFFNHPPEQEYQHRNHRQHEQ